MCGIKFQVNFRFNIGVTNLPKKSYSRKNRYLRKGVNYLLTRFICAY